MWPLIVNAVRVYAPYVVWPVAAVVGFIGYNFETMMRGDKKTPYKATSVSEQREERILQENIDKDPTQVDQLKDRKFVPKNIFERNK